jgi:hypothetical protein
MKEKSLRSLKVIEKFQKVKIKLVDKRIRCTRTILRQLQKHSFKVSQGLIFAIIINNKQNSFLVSTNL